MNPSLPPSFSPLGALLVHGKNWCRFLRWILASLCLVSGYLHAGASHEVLASFVNPPKSPSDGALVLGPDGYFWGITSSGGHRSDGTIYKIKPDGSDRQMVFSFGSSGSDSYPSGGLTWDGAGHFWGSTRYGGVNYHGTVFKFQVATGIFTTVVNFSDDTGPNLGESPVGTLTPDGAGYLWGATSSGGTNGLGTVFKIQVATGLHTTMAQFGGGSNSGQGPTGGLTTDGAGHFWGTTLRGGTHSSGTVFKIHLATGVLTTVAEFNDVILGSSLPNRGGSPNGELAADGAGFFWGTTRYGGTHSDGTVFKIHIATGAVTTVIDFNGNGPINYGNDPRAGLTADGAGFFWGTTSRGGGNDDGTVFKIHIATGILTTLVEFNADEAIYQGATPRARLTADGAGHFWGTTFNGWYNSRGSVFKLQMATGVLTTVSKFEIDEFSPHGNLPSSGLTPDGTGQLWGTTSGGGPNDNGTVFKFQPATGIVTTVVKFSGIAGPNLGESPEGPLTADGAGNLWGTTMNGGIHERGTVFRIQPATGVFTTVAEFDGAIHPGYQPFGGLTADGAGYLWGTTEVSNTAGSSGTVFKVHIATGALTTVIQFTGNGASNRGANPSGGLTLDSAGQLWGVTQNGGAFGSYDDDLVGTVFKINISTGVLTTMIEFSGDAAPNRGRRPSAGLTYDGTSMWGTTIGGYEGQADASVYKVHTLTGAFTNVFTFPSDGIHGRRPYARMIRDGAGDLWGTTSEGGLNGYGTIFRIKAATGVLATEMEFTGAGPQAGSGSAPGNAQLFLHPDGKLYGTTINGGPKGAGTLFRIQPRNTAEIAVWRNPVYSGDDPRRLEYGDAGLNFYEVRVGGPSPSQTLVIRGRSFTPLVLGSLSIDGAHSADFVVSAPSATTLAVNESSTYTVTFTPSANGPRSAVLHIPSNDPDHPSFDISLNGIGRPAYRYTLSTSATNGTITRSLNQADYEEDTVVTLTAVPQPGFTFSRWSGDLRGSNNPTAFTIDEDSDISAIFTAPFNPADVEATALPWTTGGDAGWTRDFTTTHDGTDAASSGPIVNDQQSWVETTVTGPGTLTYWWKVSSENSYDWLELYIDGALQPDRISGNVDWEQQSHLLTSGSHTVRWRYSKNGYDSSGFDTGWLDQVRWTPSASDPYTTWAAEFFTPTGLANPAVSGPTIDYDKDGIPNLLEYLLGGNPTLPSSNLLPTITKAPGSSNLVFTYKRKLAATGVTQVIEHSPNLAPPWTPAVHGTDGVTIVTSPVDAQTEQVTVTVPSTSGSRFVRLKASR